MGLLACGGGGGGGVVVVRSVVDRCFSAATVTPHTHTHTLSLSLCVALLKRYDPRCALSHHRRCGKKHTKERECVCVRVHA